MVYLVLAGFLLLLMVVTAFLGSAESALAWLRLAPVVWLSLALILALVWTLNRPRPSALRRIDSLWAHDRLATLLLVKLLIAATVLLGPIILLVARDQP